MGKKTPEISLPKSVKKSDEKVQEKYTKAFEKSYKKHHDEERAHDKAISKLEEKYEKVEKRWIIQSDIQPIKSKKKDDDKLKKTSNKLEEESQKKSEKKSSKKSDDKVKDSQKAEKSDKKIADKKDSEKKADKKSAKKPVEKKSASKKSKKQQPVYVDAYEAENADLEVSEDFDTAELDYIEENMLDDQILAVGADEGLAPEESDDPVAAQAVYEEKMASDDLEEVIDSESLPEAPAQVIDNFNELASEEPTLVETGRSLATVTRAQLYKEAQELKIPGRSSMNKEELFTAVELARK